MLLEQKVPEHYSSALGPQILLCCKYHEKNTMLWSQTMVTDQNNFYFISTNKAIFMPLHILGSGLKSISKIVNIMPFLCLSTAQYRFNVLRERPYLDYNTISLLPVPVLWCWAIVSIESIVVLFPCSLRCMIHQRLNLSFRVFRMDK